MFPASFAVGMHAPRLHSYARAYEHFRRDHHNPTNLALHCLALVYQLASNFSLLNELDRWLCDAGAPEATLSSLTSLIWASSLAIGTPAPMPVRLASAAAVCFAHTRRGKLSHRWRDLSSIMCVMEAVAFHYVIRRRPMRDWKGLAAVLLARSSVQYIAVAHRGRLARHKQKLIAILVGALLLASLRAETKLSVFSIALLGGPLALLVNEPALFWCVTTPSVLPRCALFLYWQDYFCKKKKRTMHAWYRHHQHHHRSTAPPPPSSPPQVSTVHTHSHLSAKYAQTHLLASCAL